MRKQSGVSRTSFSAVGFAAFKTEHGHSRVEIILPKLVSRHMVGAAAALVAGDKWSRSQED